MSEERRDREIEREAARGAREAERELRRAARETEREARREERRTHRAELFGDHLESETRYAAGPWATRTSATGDGREESETVERRFQVTGMPRLRLRNVSGDNSVKVGEPGEILVRARKRVHGWSEDRAKRLLENVEIRMEQDGDQITIEPRLYELERGWLDLFRGGRVAVDIDVTVPREVQIEATTVSGPVTIRGTRGPLEARSVSGEIDIDDVQGPTRLRTVSGDLRATAYAGQMEANSVSGDLRFERSRIKKPDLQSVSGDVRVEGVLVFPSDGSGEGRIKTVSGDVELDLADTTMDVEFQTLSGDVTVDTPDAKVEKRGRREWRVTVGAGGARLKVKTVSGDLSIRRSGQARPATDEAPAEEPVAAGTSSAAGGPSTEVLELLNRLARGEVSVDEAASALDQRGR